MPNPADLSEREIEILKLIATGVGNKEIAHTLRISTNTVKVHVRNIFTKLGVLSRTEATLYAIEHQIVPAPGNQVNIGNNTSPSSNPTRWLFFIIIVVLVAALAIFTWWTSHNPPASTAIPIAFGNTPTAIPRWRILNPMPDGRAGMAAVAYEGQILVFGGETSAGVSSSTLAYNIKLDQWSNLAEKPTGSKDIQAALLGEKIYIPGGNADAIILKNLEVYSPRTNTWEQKATLPSGRSGYALVSFEGRLYLFGGFDGNEVKTDVLRYDPLLDQWEWMSAMPTPAAYMNAVVIQNKILLVGGWDGQSSLEQAIEYIPARDIPGDSPWVTISSPTRPVCRYASAVLGTVDYLFMIPAGDCGSSIVTGITPANPDLVALQYVYESNSWAGIDAPPEGWLAAAAVGIPYDNYIYFLGGIRSGEYSKDLVSFQALFTYSVPVIVNP